MTFGTHSEDEEVEYVEEDNQESLLTQLLIEVGVTWFPRHIAKALITRGVRVTK